MAVLDAQADMPEASQVAEGDAAVGVDLVMANPVVSRGGGEDGAGLDPGIEGQERGAALQSATRSLLVVVTAEGIQL